MVVRQDVRGAARVDPRVAAGIVVLMLARAGVRRLLAGPGDAGDAGPGDAGPAAAG